MTDDTTDWTELREFRHIELTRSFVIAWRTEASTLVVEVDLCLAEAHPFYEAPRPSEKACFRAATIEFPDCTGVSTDAGPDGTAPSEWGGAGIGAIAGLQRTGEGEYCIVGAFGKVRIIGGRPVVRLADRFFR